MALHACRITSGFHQFDPAVFRPPLFLGVARKSCVASRLAALEFPLAVIE
jgi:hypothetical protein